jgi:hypothetical protein
VDDWGKLLGDTAAVTALLDRLLHHAHVLKCGPRSWRTKVQTDLRTEEPTSRTHLGLDRPAKNGRLCGVHEWPSFQLSEGGKKARTAPIQANRVLERSSAMLTFAMDQDWIHSNPARRVKKPGEERSRDRVLTRDKLRELCTALHQTEATDAEGKSNPRLSQTLNDMLIVMLLTAQSWRSLPHALAEGRSAHGLVDDSGGHIQERRCASRPADAMTLANLRLHADEPHADRSWPERGNLLTTEK